MISSCPRDLLRVPRSTKRSSWLKDAGLLGIVIVMVALWTAGYPLPHVDDLFYTGASIELARSGQLENPFLIVFSDSLGSLSFYSIPPALPYLLAAWIKCFGVSTVSLTGFHVFVQFLLVLVVYRVVRSLGGGTAGSLAAAWVALIFPITYGMRPDALAMLLAVAGCLLATQRTSLLVLVGSLVAALAVLTHPLAAALVIPPFFYLWCRSARHPMVFLKILGASLAGVLIAFALFLLAIRGELMEFMRVLAATRDLIMRPSLMNRPAEFVTAFTMGQQLWLTAPALLLIAGSIIRCSVVRSHTGSSRDFDLWLLWLGALAIGIFLYPGRMAHYALSIGLVLVLVSSANHRFSFLVAALVAAAAAISNAGSLLFPFFGELTKPDLAGIRHEIELRQQTGQKVLCLDEVAARYVFDFNLPEGSRDWILRQPAQTGIRSLQADKPADELWVVNEWKLERYVDDSGVRSKRLQVAGRTIESLPHAPFRLRIIE